jgi:predicted DNA-binding protein
MEEPITKPMSFAVTKEQKSDIRKAARKAGVKTSTYIREAVLKRMQEEEQ